MLEFLSKVGRFGKIMFLIFFAFTSITLLFNAFGGQKTPLLDDKNLSREQERISLYKQYNDKKLNNTKQKRATVELVKIFNCQFLGELCTNNPADATKHFSSSLLGKTMALVAYPMQNPPASGVAWVYERLQDSHLAPSAFAAEGVGFSAIKPLSQIWIVFRNASLLLLTLFIALIGILIMVRVKINPQTVITLENSLPRIFITILLIIFSFPIAGMMIDLMYVVILVGISLFGHAYQGLDVAQAQRNYTSGSYGVIWDAMFPIKTFWSSVPIVGRFINLFMLGTALADSLPIMLNTIIREIASVFLLSNLLAVLYDTNHFGFLGHIVDALKGVNILAESPGNVVSDTVAWSNKLTVILVAFPLFLIFGIGFIIGFIILFTIFFLLIRIFILLFACYVRIILYIIFAPFMILPTAIPGKNGFASWLKSLAAQLAAFPTLVFLLITAYVVVNAFDFGGTHLWHPPFLGSLGRKDISILIGMQILFIAPDLIRHVQANFFGWKPMAVRTGIAPFFGGAIGGAAGGRGLLESFSQLRSVLVGGYGTGLISKRQGTFANYIKRALGASTGTGPSG